MSNFIINFSRVILFVILSMSSQACIAMDPYDDGGESFCTGSSLKRQRTNRSDDRETDNSGFETPSSEEENLTGSMANRIKALSQRHANFTFVPASSFASSFAFEPQSLGTLPEQFTAQPKALFSKENLVDGSEKSKLKGAWYQKSETGNWVLKLSPVKGCATIIPGASVELLFGSGKHVEIFKYYPSVLKAQQAAEDMATQRGIPFSKKAISSKRKPFLRRK